MAVTWVSGAFPGEVRAEALCVVGLELRGDLDTGGGWLAIKATEAAPDHVVTSSGPTAGCYARRLPRFRFPRRRRRQICGERRGSFRSSSAGAADCTRRT